MADEPLTDTPAAARGEDRGVLWDLPLLAGVPAEVRSVVVDSFERRRFSFGDVILEEGVASSAMYVVVRGFARIVRRGPGNVEVPLRRVGPGATFGAPGLLLGRPASATVRASGDLEVFALDAALLRALSRNHPQITADITAQARRYELSDLFRVDSQLPNISPAAVDALVDALEPIEVPAGTVVIEQGQPPSALYFVESGRLRAQRRDGDTTRNIGFFRRGDHIGDLSILHARRASGTVTTVTSAALLRIDAKRALELLEAHPDIRDGLLACAEQRSRHETGNVPLDFPELLPADVVAQLTVNADEVDVVDTADATTPPPAETDPLFAGPRPRIRRFPMVWQVDTTDCGAACLTMICKYFGREVSLAHIRSLINTSTDGTSLSGIVLGAEDLGLAAKTLKSSPANLDRLPLPAVAHYGGNHWVVVHEVSESQVRVADPGAGPRRMDRVDFAAKWTGYCAVFARTPAFDSAPEADPPWSWLLPFFRPHLRTLGAALSLSVVLAAMQASLPMFTKYIVDDVIPGADRGRLTVAVLGLAFILACTAGATLTQGYLISRVAVRLDGATLDHITARMLSLPMRYFNTRRIGDIERRLAGVQQVRRFVVQTGLLVISSLVTLIVALIAMASTSRLLTGIFLAVTPVYLVLVRLSNTRLRPIFETLEEASASYQSHQIDAIRGIETVKALGAEEALRARIAGEFEALSRTRFRSDFTILAYTGLVQLTTFFTLGLFLWLGALQVIEGHLTVGGMVAFNSLVLLANGPVLAMLSVWDDFQASSVMLNRLNDVFVTAPEQDRDNGNLRPVPSLAGDVEIVDLSFRFGGPRSPEILHGISFHAKAGTRVAIVGRSGSGKTTLIKCLAGLLPPTTGTIRYDGIDLKELDYRQLRRQIGFVLQENYVFDDTIAANIAFGAAPDRDRLRAAARVAHAHEFIERLPLRYETRIGESGLMLSGGQRQRIAIARAVYHRPPILIFDEATSALDTESELAVRQSVDDLLAGRTSFVIAHRLSTIRDADVILVIEQGELVEQGSHAELLALGGLYAHLCSQQLDL